MSPYNKNILIIDDKVTEIEAEIIMPLSRMSFIIEKQSNPESGLEVASHKYSVIFIDFKFDNSTKHNGTSLCYSIRKKCPLSTLILLTAFGKENIDQFTHAPWDGYFEKGKKGIRARELDSILENCLNEAVGRRYDKTPYLKNMPNEETKIKERIDILNKLQNLFVSNSAAKRWNDEAIAKQLGYNNRTALSQKFTTTNSETDELKKDALIFRHIIINKLTDCTLAKEHYAPLKNLVDFFYL